jgi:D-alanyl-D-alanine carboxypeptidase
VSSVCRDERHIVAVVLGGTSNAARDARMRQLIEDHISQASTRQTAPVIAEANGEDEAHEGAAHPGAVVPATRNEAPMDGDATLARAQADPVPIPRPRIRAGEHPLNKAKLAVTSKAPPNRVQRLTASGTSKVSTSK